MSDHASKRPERKMKANKHFSKKNSTKSGSGHEHPNQIKNKKEKYLQPGRWEELIEETNEELVEETPELSITE